LFCIDVRKNFTMGVWSQVAQYLYLKKKDPNTPNTQFVRYMHGINRISILLFLAGLVILAIKLFRR
jgi:Ni,Fe-hydrogenase I cytochrome b subunit